MDIHSKSMDKLFERLSKKHGQPKIAIKLIIQAQFEFAKDVMKKVNPEKDFWPYARLPMLCAFKIKKGKIKYLKKRNKKNPNYVRRREKQ